MWNSAGGVIVVCRVNTQSGNIHHWYHPHNIAIVWPHTDLEHTQLMPSSWLLTGFVFLPSSVTANCRVRVRVGWRRVRHWQLSPGDKILSTQYLQTIELQTKVHKDFTITRWHYAKSKKFCSKLLKMAVLQPPDWIQRKKNTLYVTNEVSLQQLKL